MLVPPEKIEEILERVDIVAVVSRYVELKRAGRSFKGRCPFHEEKTPSFHVTPDLKRFKCFGCDAGGDAIAFLRRYQGKSFLEVVRDLAREAGVELVGADDPRAKERSRLFQVNELAQAHFVKNLSFPSAGAARAHLASRGVSEAMQRAFGIGYATPQWGDLDARLSPEGMAEAGAQAGLIAPRKRGGGFYDVFRGRITIPIRSHEGRVIGFGARVLEGLQTPEGAEIAGPKYLNSKESLVYVKGEVLFGLDRAKDAIRKAKSAVLVEGYFDCIGLHQAGIENVVALCSTALTSKHLELLSRADAREIVLCLDGDAAGQKAVERLATPILAASITARVAVLPEGDDPDTFAGREGTEKTRALLASAPPLTEYLLRRALPQGRGSTWEQQVSALKLLLPVTESMPASLEKSLFLSKVAEHLGVSEEEVKGRMAGKAPAVAVPSPAQAFPRRAPRPPDAEEFIAALLLSDPSLFAEEAAAVVDELGDLSLRSLLAGASGGEASSALLEASPELSRRLSSRMEAVGRTFPDAAARKAGLADAARKLRLDRVKERLGSLAKEIRRCGDAGAEEETSRLQEEFSKLSQVKERLVRA